LNTNGVTNYGDGQFSALVGQFSADKVDNLAPDFKPILATPGNFL